MQQAFCRTLNLRRCSPSTGCLMQLGCLLTSAWQHRHMVQGPLTAAALAALLQVHCAADAHSEGQQQSPSWPWLP